MTALWRASRAAARHAEGVGALAVELVDERDARDLVAAHLAVDRDRLRLHARHAAQHQDRAVEHAQRALDLDGEVDVPGVSMMLMKLVSFHSQCVAADWIVMPRSRSSSIESILAPTPSLPFTS
jgi:hypothetical protein